MGKVKITYSKIKDAAKSAQKASNYYDDFSTELTKSVYNKLIISYGNDSKGYVSNARNVVSNKVKDLNNKKKKYSDLSTSLYNLKATVENCENNAKKSVTKIATDELELKNRKWYQKVGDWIYGTVCVDLLNSNPITRGLGNLIKSGMDYFDYGFDKLVDWFKHGDGKYYLNIALSVLGDIAAIAGTVAAIALCAAATVATGGVATPLLVAAIASGIGTIMTVVDSGFSIYNNFKALKISKDSNDPGRARYYGNIDGVSSTIGKYDMGGEKANKIWGYIGTGYDVTHTVADVTAIVAGSVGSAGLTETATKTAGGKTIKTYSYDKTKIKGNLKNTTLEKIGFRKQAGTGKYKFNMKNLFSTKKPTKGSALGQQELIKDRVLRKKYGNRNSHIRKRLETISNIEKIVKKPGKTKSIIDNTEKIINPNTGGYDRTKSVIKVITGTSDVSGKKWRIVSPIKDVDGTIRPIIDTIKDWAS